MSRAREFTPPRRLKKYTSKCPQCGGSIKEQTVTLVYPTRNGEPRVIHGVPAGVCQACGEKYLRPSVAKTIEKLLSERAPRREEVEAWDYAAASG